MELGRRRELAGRRFGAMWGSVKAFPIAALPFQPAQPASVEPMGAGDCQHISLWEKRNEGYREVSGTHTHGMDTKKSEQGTSLPELQL